MRRAVSIAHLARKDVTDESRRHLGAAAKGFDTAKCVNGPKMYAVNTHATAVSIRVTVVNIHATMATAGIIPAAAAIDMAVARLHQRPNAVDSMMSVNASAMMTRATNDVATRRAAQPVAVRRMNVAGFAVSLTTTTTMRQATKRTNIIGRSDVNST